MPNLPYQTSGWDTHSQSAAPHFDYPLFDRGCGDHFVLTRTYEGPSSTFVLPALDTVDTVYHGTATAVTGAAATDLITYSSAPGLRTGDKATLAISSGLTGLTAGSVWLIRISATTFKLAASRADAIAGTAIDITADGSGTLAPLPAYLVDHSRLEEVDGGAIRYTRTFANVPDQWSDLESFAFLFPGYLAGSAGTSFSVTSIAPAALGTVILGTSATGITVGEVCTAGVLYTRGGVKYAQTFQGAATAVSSGASVTLPGTLLGSVGSASAVSGTVVEWTTGRGTAAPLTVGSRLVHDYALTSIASLDSDLPISQQFRPVDSGGLATDALTASSVPTSAEYASMVANRAEIAGEASIRRRYMGNIYVRATRLVTAT